MAIEKARAWLEKWNAAGKILEFQESSATVELQRHYPSMLERLLY